MVIEPAASGSRPLHRAIERCLLCSSARLERVLALEPIPIATPNSHVAPEFEGDPRLYAAVPLELNLCNDCGQLQVGHVPDLEFEYRDYAYTTSLSAGLRGHYARYAAEVFERYALRADGTAVEIGSNDGTLLRNFAERGMRVLGIDPARKIAAAATERGIETLPEFFTAELARAIRAERGSADVILANNVTANLENMQDFAAAIHSLLDPGGIAVFETGYGLDVIERALLDTVYHEHVSYFNVGPLHAYYERAGLELIDAHRVDTKGGSVRLVVQHRGGPRRATENVAALLAEEERKGIRDTRFYAALPPRIAAIRDRLGELVAAMRSAGREIAGWGASIGTMALLPQFGLSREIAYVFDDDPNKDAFMRGPDYAIPVVRGSEILHRQPGAVIVFAWRYIAPIMKAHHGYLQEGGKFVVPLPEVAVVDRPGAPPPNTLAR